MFLTLEDPRARVKGSRDPLAAQPLWQSFGRHVVVNLTTVTTSVRSFTVHLLGRWAAERLIEDERALPEDAFPIFLRCECMGAYIRHVLHGVSTDIRGIEAVRGRAAEGRRFSISDRPEDLILGDQRTGGLWGLYTASARASGLVEEGPVGLSPRSRSLFGEVYEPILGKAADEFLRLARRGGTLDVHRNKPLAKALGQILAPTFGADEAAFYADVLRDARFASERAPGRQERLASLMMEQMDLEARVDRAGVARLEQAAAREDAPLASRLSKIQELESLLAPAMALFSHVLSRQGAEVNTVAGAVTDRWGASVPHVDLPALANLRHEMAAAVGEQTAGEALACAAALEAGDYDAAIRRLCAWNALVMEARGSAPWLRIERDRLDVHYRLAEEWLPDGDELPELWRNSYFLDALRWIALELAGGAA